MESGPKSFLFYKWGNKSLERQAKELAQGHTASTWWSWGLNPGLTLTLYSHTMPPLRLPIVLAFLWTFSDCMHPSGLIWSRCLMKPPSNNPDLCTLRALNFCRATALASHPQLHSIIPLVSSRHHTLCQLEVLFCLAITLICLPKKGKVWLINIYFGLSTMLDLLIVRFHEKKNFTPILLLIFYILYYFLN